MGHRRGHVRNWLRIACALAASVGLAFAIDRWIGDRSSIAIDAFDRPIELLAPRWLLLASAIPIVFLLRRLSLTDLSAAQLVVQATLRSCVVAGIALSLARPSWITEQSKLATIVLVDVSDSVSDGQLAAAQRYVDELAADGGDASVQLVTFAERPLVVRAALRVGRHPGAGAGTDIQSAMQLAYGLFPEGHLRRMVIVTDGNQTVGDVAVEAYRAKELGVKVSWRTFDHERTSEVRVAGVIVPDDLKVGQPFDVTAEVWSTEAQTVTLALRQDEFPNPREPRKTVELREGKNLVRFRSEAKLAGATTYTVRLEQVARDTERANNSAVMTAPVTGRPSVLYVEGTHVREPGSSSYLSRALAAQNIDVTVRGPDGMPRTAKDLEKYDLVFVSDVPAHVLSPTSIAALDEYVARLGGGLVMAGGQDSFGSGGYQNTRIEQMMPVRFDSKQSTEKPDVALALVIDRSSSMEGPNIEAAKESARVTVEALAPRDFITVIAFDQAATTIVPMQRAGNRFRISSDIARLAAGGGTDIRPGLRAAHESLNGIDAKVKHAIVLSDGEAPEDGLVEIVQAMRADHITVSAVGVPGASRRLLEKIIEAGDGRIEMIDDLGALPKFFIDETSTVKKSSLVEDEIHVRVAKHVEAIEGTNVENAPTLHGYVTTQPKPTGEMILISDAGEPLLARWRYGAGTSVAWTSDVKNRWSANWIRWNGYAKFWAQVVRSSMRRKAYDSYELAARVADGRATVTVDAVDAGDKFVNGLDTQLEVIDPKTNKPTQTLAMAQTAAGRYTATFAIQRYGSYLLKAIHKRDGKTVAESLGGVALSYPLEYLRTTPNPEPLRHAARVSGGIDQAPVAKLLDPGDESVAATRELWPYVLLGVIVLMLLDLYAKRVRLFGYRARPVDS